MSAVPPRPYLRPVCLAAALALTLASATAPVADEAVHFSERLRHLMQRMNALLHERNQSELEIDRERLARARELAVAATELAGEAAAIGPPAGADATAQDAFTVLARALADEAAELDRLAAASRYAELPAQMERVAHRCADCHLRFRDRAP
ncbi:MAG: hypothetical protein AB7Q81_07375 [Gammaproteobacteria bacterium]